MYIRRYSSIKNYLQHYNNKPLLQPVNTSWRAKEGPAGGSYYARVSMSRGESYKEQTQPQTRTTGDSTPPSEAPPTGAATKPIEEEVGEADGGETTSSSLILLQAQQDQPSKHHELRAVTNCNNFYSIPVTMGITMDHAPTGSPSRQILVAAGSGWSSTSTTEWNMYNMCEPEGLNELYTLKPILPKTYPQLIDQGGTQPARERNLPQTNLPQTNINLPQTNIKLPQTDINTQNKYKKIKYNKNPIKLTQTSIKSFITNGVNRQNNTLTTVGNKKPIKMIPTIFAHLGTHKTLGRTPNKQTELRKAKNSPKRLKKKEKIGLCVRNLQKRIYLSKNPKQPFISITP